MSRHSFRRKSYWLYLAEFASLTIGLAIFRIVRREFSAETFADWEWMRVWLGLCLLIPRNGADIVIQRCCARHPASLREWTAVTLVLRLPLSLAALAVFRAGAFADIAADPRVLWPMALTLPFSAASPDLAARVQGRFRLAGTLFTLKNLVILMGLAVSPSDVGTPVGLACLTLAAETVSCLAWWVDAWRSGGMPGGRWRTMLLRVRSPLVRRSVEQTVARWSRVLSWNLDAIVLAPMAPALWSIVAPARALLMTAFLPVAGYFGSVAPLLGRIEAEPLRQRSRHIASASLVLGGLCTFAAIACGHRITSIVFGPDRAIEGPILAITAARFAPLAIMAWLAVILTAMRRDRAAAWFGLMSPLVMAIVMFLATTAEELPGRFAYSAVVAGEWAVMALCWGVSHAAFMTEIASLRGDSLSGVRSGRIDARSDAASERASRKRLIFAERTPA